MCGGLKKSDIYEMHMCADTIQDMQDAKAEAEAAKELCDTEGDAGVENGNLMTETGQKLLKEAGTIGGDETAAEHGTAATKFGGDLEHAGAECKKLFALGMPSPTNASDKFEAYLPIMHYVNMDFN